MVKKKFGGEKVDVKGVLAPAPAPKQSSGPCWASGAGAAAKAPAPGPAPSAAAAVPKGTWARGAGAAVAPAPKSGPAPGRTPAVGSWAKGGPQGLAATATSVQAQPKFAPAQRPKPAGIAAGASRPALGLKQDRGPAAPVFDDEAFPEAERLKTAAEKAEEAALAKAARCFPEVSSCSEALAALCSSAGASETTESGKLEAGLSWLLRAGLPAASSSEDRAQLLKAGALVVEGLASQEKHANKIQEILEGYFAEQQQKGKNTPQMLEANGLVDAMLFGGLGKQLEAASPRQVAIRLRLLRRLQKPTTPEVVQGALASALIPLLAADPEAVDDVCNAFMEGLVAAQEALRRGAALGIAAAIKGGGGTSALKRLGIIEKVKELAAAPGKNGSGKRQGALLLLQALAEALGRTFEPYALSSMPMLLESCADSSKEVQQAGKAAATTVVAQVSSAGVRLMVNPVLEGLKDKKWRTQLSAAELLKPIVSELIANAPKRLNAVMPKAVPALCEAGAGARHELRDAAREVLELIGTAIDHAEVAALAPSLIAALMDPGEASLVKALDSLLSAVYTSTVSGASCALICPVVERALTRGDAEVRQKGASFVRTLSQWAVDAEELGPYLAILRPQLQGLLGDPAPLVRDAAAQAIGALSAAFSSSAGAEDSDVAAGLLERLSKAGDSTDTEGAAQGLAASMATASPERRAELLEEILEGAAKIGDAGRLGRLATLAHLPKALKDTEGGERDVASSLPVLSAALADKEEAVRVAGRRGLAAAAEGAIGAAGAAAVAEELQAILRMSDGPARIAGAELALLLLPQRSFSTPAALGARSNLIAAAVLAQADPVATVRRAADRVWRAATEAGGGNPGKQLKDLRPLLLERLEADFRSGEDSVTITAGRAAVQLQSRLESSKGVLEDLLPGLCEALESADASERRSVCIGLAEVLQDNKCQSVALQGGSLVVGIKAALLESGEEEGDGDLRDAAALCCTAAPAASLVEPILDELCSLEYSLDEAQRLGLHSLMKRAGNSGTSASLLPATLARVSPPFHAAKLDVLGAAAAAPPAALARIAATAAAVFVDAAAATLESSESVEGYAAEFVAALDEPGASEFFNAALSRVERGQGSETSEGAARVLAAALGALKAPPADSEALLDAVVPGVLLASPAHDRCVSSFAAALQALVRLTGAASIYEALASCLASALADAGATMPEGSLAAQALDALAPLLQQGATSAGQQRRSLAVSAATLFRRADGASLQAHAVKLTGPLVRSLGEKPVDPELQAAVVAALLVLLERAGSTLRPLVPALQTALVRLLEGPEEIHDVVACALGAMAPLVPKAEALVKALSKPPARAANLAALEKVLLALGPPPLPAQVLAEAKVATDSAAQDAALSGAAKRVAAAMGGK
eukprot:TRINITY_DN28564_c0_g1_i1.p1 TRINITY_DN28564_c0_g1~~TRINITY_DN28564_c0_g1_i1.p1  ORF type:complete len:1399 (-),score=392.40 TRINITY_DN28564_c0_g1_i1:33-4229(-)